MDKKEYSKLREAQGCCVYMIERSIQMKEGAKTKYMKSL